MAEASHFPFSAFELFACFRWWSSVNLDIFLLTLGVHESEKHSHGHPEGVRCGSHESSHLLSAVVSADEALRQAASGAGTQVSLPLPWGRLRHRGSCISEETVVAESDPRAGWSSPSVLVS